ncbi:MAG: hypothetical protein Q9162_002579 [Coniocarpon cinnabarinum]
MDAAKDTGPSLDKLSLRPDSGRERILLTGASGFIATHILIAFLGAGYNVRGTVRSEAAAQEIAERFAPNVHSKQLTFAIIPDIAAAGAFDGAVKGVDGIIHTASPVSMFVEDSERDLLQPAMNGVNELLGSVQKHSPQVRRIIMTSSCVAVIDFSKGPRPGYTYGEDDWNPITYEEAKAEKSYAAYFASKKLAEETAWNYVKNNRVTYEFATICPPMVYGPPAYEPDMKRIKSSVGDASRFMNGTTTEPGPTLVPAFVDVRDVAEAHLRAYEKEGLKGRYLLTAGEFQYVDICRILREQVPRLRDKVPDPEQTVKVETFKIDGERAKTELGMKLRPLSESIADTATWLMQAQQTQAAADSS